MGEELGTRRVRARDAALAEGEPLTLALAAYKRLFMEGVAHSLVLRSDRTEPIEGWEISWIACDSRVCPDTPGDPVWKKVMIRNRSTYVLGASALHALHDSFLFHGIEL